MRHIVDISNHGQPCPSHPAIPDELVQKIAKDIQAYGIHLHKTRKSLKEIKTWLRSLPPFYVRYTSPADLYMKFIRR